MSALLLLAKLLFALVATLFGALLFAFIYLVFEGILDGGGR